jgi:hypothetical protein
MTERRGSAARDLCGFQVADQEFCLIGDHPRPRPRLGGPRTNRGRFGGAGVDGRVSDPPHTRAGQGGRVMTQNPQLSGVDLARAAQALRSAVRAGRLHQGILGRNRGAASTRRARPNGRPAAYRT